MSKQRLVKIVTKGNNTTVNRVLDEQSDQHEYIDETGGDGDGIATDDDEGNSIAYVEDYEIAGNSDDTDGDGFFVEYVTEDDDNLAMNAAAAAVSGDSNDSVIESPLVEYEDADADGGGDGAVELYNCSSCGMNFKSVTEHIQKHHPNQDVLIDISDENGATTIKREKTLDLDDDDDDDDDAAGDDDDIDNDHDDGGGNGDEEFDSNDVGTFITSNTVGMVDGELIVYGGGSGGDDDSLESELIDDVLDETGDSVVYTYDDATGQITRATTANSVAKRNTTKITGANKPTVNEIHPARQFYLIKIFFCSRFLANGRAKASKTISTISSGEVENAQRSTSYQRSRLSNL